MRKTAELFLELYGGSLDKREALKESGLGARDIRKMTEPRFLDYDEEFTEGFLQIEELVKAEMMSIALAVAHSDGRQRLAAARWLAGETDREVDRVETAHVRWLEDRAREQALAGRDAKEIGGNGTGSSIEEMKSGGGSFARLTE